MEHSPQVFSVTQINQVVRELLEQGVGTVWVEGEISNLRRQASGHQYFTLKDERCQLSCVQFRSWGGSRLGTLELKDGMQVQAFGRLTVYEARGQYQLNVQMVQSRGAGLLQAKFEALKRKLDEEGLFDASRKKALPEFPSRIGIVTSPSGAAIQDMLNVLSRRAPWVEIVVYPAKVQGAGAAGEIAEGIAAFNRWSASGGLPVDLLITGRGGGSIEDLWAFNEEVVARAIAASEIPVVSAVGHEIDFTIADFVADLRAPTPSAAAELVAPDRADLQRRITRWETAIRGRLEEFVRHAQERLRLRTAGALLREPIRRIQELHQEVDDAALRMENSVTLRLERSRAALRERVHQVEKYRPGQVLAQARDKRAWLASRLERAALSQVAEQKSFHREKAAMLRLLGPGATLDRGYSITLDAEGHPLRSVKKVSAGESIVTRLADGDLRSTVDRKSTGISPASGD